jgi:glycosyltransferase involved in cell wall biosynthesis
MATVRVHLCTYRRNQLLRRAVDSLRGQTFTDWVCELHNDDPTDRFPATLVAELNDPRIIDVTHPVNLGPTPTFNLMYRAGVAEPYVSLLEDDNWWDPNFLSVMVREMDARPEVPVGWANMRLWQEESDGTWSDMGRCVWKETGVGGSVLFKWPDLRQLRGALHSNGAMLIRSRVLESLQVPDSTPFAVIEGVRERRFEFPILFVPSPLANFAVTRQTARGDDRALWGQCQVLLAASFLSHVRLGGNSIKEVWSDARSAVPSVTNTLIAAGLVDRRARYIWGGSGLSDWVRFVLSFIRRPKVVLRVLRAKSALPEVWAALDDATRRTHARAGEPTELARNPTPGSAQGAVRRDC